jgi:aryl-alcohol dehydrogenase-like predicted oxidoreductase
MDQRLTASFMGPEARVPLGSTGLLVSRVGLAQGYGVPTASIEKAVREYGINYLYISPIMKVRNMVRAVRNLAPGSRDDLCIVLARPLLKSARLESYVERWLNKLGLDWIDLLFQDTRKPFSDKLSERVLKLRESGKVRHLGMSSHDRQLYGRLARGELRIPVDFWHIRYNAVHAGAEQDIFPHLPDEKRPGIVIFTATCWRKLLKAKRMPTGESPLTAAECYRFVLSHPDVNVCITAPSSTGRMEQNFKALEAGPLNDEEMARVRRIGRHVYGSRKRVE